MKKNNTIHTNIVNFNNITKSTNKIISKLSLILLLIFAVSFVSKVQAQEITQSITDISSTIKKYTFTYKLSDTEKKDIRYIFVKSSTGDIKSCFDACDVCFAANKGYSQSGTELRCNNCGKKFKIDELGTQGKGGCWPAHLPHTSDAQNVVLNNSDLIEGSYLFPQETISDVNDNNKSSSIVIIVQNEKLTVKLANSVPRNLKVISLDGRIIKDVNSLNNEISIDISNLSSGIYFVLTEIDGKPFSKSFYIFK